ncbi:hypothetical protein JCM8547_003860 [Rhodosporidiobolus lusitaniae]
MVASSASPASSSLDAVERAPRLSAGLPQPDSRLYLLPDSLLITSSPAFTRSPFFSPSSAAESEADSLNAQPLKAQATAEWSEDAVERLLKQVKQLNERVRELSKEVSEKVEENAELVLRLSLIEG